MELVSTEEMRQREEALFARGVEAENLMEAAGRGIAAIVRAHFPGVARAAICVGKGNNGGDGLVVARHLVQAGWQADIYFAYPSRILDGLPKKQWKNLPRSKRIVCLESEEEWIFPEGTGVVIDALLGTGMTEAPRPEIAARIAQINENRRRLFLRTVAVDVPSGLRAEGEYSEAVVADRTVTVGLPKDLLVREDLAHWVGNLDVVPLPGIESGAGDEVLTEPELRGLLPRRSAAAHKGTFGHVAILGGSKGFAGAPALAGEAALRIGAGLVSIGVPEEVWVVVSAKARSEAMVFPLEDHAALHRLWEKASAMVIGPGLGIHARRVLSLVREKTKVPLVVDADALNALAAEPGLLKGYAGPMIWTPHPGEMQRLLGREFTAAARAEVARELARAQGVTVVLKGARTVVASPEGAVAYNSTGNAGMATGGSGDVLAGMLGALLGQGLKPWDAARLGVWWHGRAGDDARNARGCEEGMLPGDLIGCLAQALCALRNPDGG
jgi:hydroxyethylthiazole kinase-like uncharacterized protein yjeF